MKSNSFCARYYHSLPWNLQILFFLTQTQLRQTPWETPPMEEAFSVKVFVFSALETGWDTLLGICRILFPPSLNFMLTQSHVQPLPYKSSSKKGQSTFFFFFLSTFWKEAGCMLDILVLCLILHLIGLIAWPGKSLKLRSQRMTPWFGGSVKMTWCY